MAEPSQQGTIGPTKVGGLVVVFVAGGLLGFLIVPVADWLGEIPPTVEWPSVLGLVIAAITVLALALSTYRTVHRDRRPIAPQRALNFLIFAKACAYAGSLIVGGYLGFASHFVGSLDIELPRQRVVRSLLAAVAALVVVIGGLLLERSCRIPRDDGPPPPPPPPS